MKRAESPEPGRDAIPRLAIRQHNIGRVTAGNLGQLRTLFRRAGRANDPLGAVRRSVRAKARVVRLGHADAAERSHASMRSGVRPSFLDDTLTLVPARIVGHFNTFITNGSARRFPSTATLRCDFADHRSCGPMARGATASRPPHDIDEARSMPFPTGPSLLWLTETRRRVRALVLNVRQHSR